MKKESDLLEIGVVAIFVLFFGAILLNALNEAYVASHKVEPVCSDDFKPECHVGKSAYCSEGFWVCADRCGIEPFNCEDAECIVGTWRCSGS